ncbi:MAG: zinc-dependent peptidase [Thiomicrorhabdus chilensis]|uniref:M90 family metallopeptidase n=1 Tax=Thiomicrorhabdus chilensis TaxID=63656 RepID=UPI00299CE3E6|nr:zinc-dependent peptidase [Thiomicrorhabdus chilensis]MDX1347018.1 zinc-dependent peptidase [Thiomicrorhabdus chilensis]
MTINPFKWLKRLLIRSTLIQHPIPHDIWRSLMHQALIFKGLNSVEKAHLRELSVLFLQNKNFIGAQQLQVTEEMKVAVAAQACLPILKLGLDYYDGWHNIILYPSTFKVKRRVIDAIGLVSEQEHLLGGEAWSTGPVIVSWEQVKANLVEPKRGHNVVIHEFAHKLDMLNGVANGLPPLHSGMIRKEWTEAFNSAFSHLLFQTEHGLRPDIDPYAATSAAEFFAVCSEYFFSAPNQLFKKLPEIYHILSLFYRQNPRSRQIE